MQRTTESAHETSELHSLTHTPNMKVVAALLRGAVKANESPLIQSQVLYT